MNAEQVIEGVGKAVAATKPAQEYCFFGCQHWSMCMTKNEWSGWMQVIGSMLAIWITWRIATTKQRKSEESNLRVAALDAATLIGEMRGVISLLDCISISYNIFKTNKNLSLEKIDFLIKKIELVSIRPLNQQEKMVYLGFEYLELMSKTILKKEYLKREALFVRDAYFINSELVLEKYEEVCEGVENLIECCEKINKLLEKFTLEQGVWSKSS